MPWFEFICLANSYKKRGRCIAGLRTDGGGWIRPCADTNFGELYPHHYNLQDGSEPSMLDVIRVFCESRQTTPHQPENWLIGRVGWRLVHRPAPASLIGLVRESLCRGSGLLGDANRRIAYEQLVERPAASSLALIAPRDLQWHVGSTPTNPRKARAQFRLAGAVYSLPVTDPAWMDAFRALEIGTHPVTACGIEPGRKLLLTISLSEPFDDGNCYKLVTAIIPEPLAPAEILAGLANGIDPFTGQRLSGAYARPETVQALRLAADALSAAHQHNRKPLERAEESASPPQSKVWKNRL